MTARARHIRDPDAAAPVDDGLRGGLDFIAMAEVALTHGGPAARRGAVRALGWIDGTEPDPAVALGMTGSGRAHPRQRLRQMRRDAALRALWRANCPTLV